MSLQELIEKQRAEMAKPRPKSAAPVEFAGEMVEVEVTKLALPDDWQNLVAAHPPRDKSLDGKVGYNQTTLPAAYPAACIKVAGESVTQEQWAEIWASLESYNRINVNTMMWGLNHYAAMLRLSALGKAAAAQQSSSAAPSASPRAGSKGGSPRKSRATTTQKAR